MLFILSMNVTLFSVIILEEGEEHSIEAPPFPHMETSDQLCGRLASLRWFVWAGALGLVAPPGALLFVL